MAYSLNSVEVNDRIFFESFKVLLITSVLFKKYTIVMMVKVPTDVGLIYIGTIHWV